MNVCTQSSFSFNVELNNKNYSFISPHFCWFPIKYYSTIHNSFYGIIIMNVMYHKNLQHAKERIIHKMTCCHKPVCPLLSQMHVKFRSGSVDTLGRNFYCFPWNVNPIWTLVRPPVTLYFIYWPSLDTRII